MTQEITIFTKRFWPIIIAFIVTLLFISGTIFVKKSGAFGVPFGGRITTVIPCTCSGGLLLSVGPPIPAINIVYQPGISRLFQHRSLRPGAWSLGNYTPGAGICLTGAPPFCFPLPATGLISIVGTSL